jgi:hypothetical protein
LEPQQEPENLIFFSYGTGMGTGTELFEKRKK